MFWINASFFVEQVILVATNAAAVRLNLCYQKTVTLHGMDNFLFKTRRKHSKLKYTHHHYLSTTIHYYWDKN